MNHCALLPVGPWYTVHRHRSAAPCRLVWLSQSCSAVQRGDTACRVRASHLCSLLTLCYCQITEHWHCPVTMGCKHLVTWQPLVGFSSPSDTDKDSHSRLYETLRRLVHHISDTASSIRSQDKWAPRVPATKTAITLSGKRPDTIMIKTWRVRDGDT